ncbi:MAG TPA: substrate-binding domain-containing protein [Firmicutes bacterium]|nr:substrate-binding domain-containing protein [Bacillota bacterium]
MKLQSRLVLALVVIMLFANAGLAAAQYTFGYVVQDLGNQFWVTVAEGIKDRAAELGIEVIVLDARADVNRQLSNVEDLLLRGIDALLLSPWDTPSGGTAVEAANRAGVPVVVVDIGVSSGDIVSFIVSDNYYGGVLAGEHMLELVGNEGKVAMIQTQLGYEIPALRGHGFEDTVTEAGLEIVAKQTGDSQRALGMSVMENYLQAYPDLVGIFAYNDEMALGAVEAIRQANMQDKIKVIGFDAIDDAIEAVKNGDLAATVAQQPYLMGQTGVDTALAYLNGEEVEDEVLVEVQLITKETLAD